ncbi:MAG: hypothetical protein WDM89_06385 [Rhizomicrobium sp.]
MIEHLLRFVAVGSVVIGAVAIFITVRNNSLQLGAQIFLAYSDRVRAIRRGAMFNSGDPEAATAAIYLIFEFYELRRRRYVSGSIWSIWDADIADLLRTEAFKAEWDVLRHNFQNHPHFRRWVDALQQTSAAIKP